MRELKEVVRHLAIGLRDLDFSSNFRSFEETITVAATTESQIRNKLPFKPTKYLIVSQSGNGLITKSPTSEWTDSQIYMYNNGAASVTCTIIFFR